MAQYFVQEEGPEDDAHSSHGPFEGLAVARAFAQRKSQDTERAVVVRDAGSGEALARFEPARPSGDEATPLARSVRRMRAANDRLKQALNAPAGGARGGERK
jgi:hypothetical protein